LHLISTTVLFFCISCSKCYEDVWEHAYIIFYCIVGSYVCEEYRWRDEYWHIPKRKFISMLYAKYNIRIGTCVMLLLLLPIIIFIVNLCSSGCRGGIAWQRTTSLLYVLCILPTYHCYYYTSLIRSRPE